MKSVACVLLLAAFLLVADPIASSVVQPRLHVVYVMGDQEMRFPSSRRRRNHYANIW